MANFNVSSVAGTILNVLNILTYLTLNNPLRWVLLSPSSLFTGCMERVMTCPRTKRGVLCLCTCTKLYSLSLRSALWPLKKAKL